MKGQSASRTALITGAAGGIGKAVAARFAAEGTSIAMVDMCALDLRASRKSCRPAMRLMSVPIRSTCRTAGRSRIA